MLVRSTSLAEQALKDAFVEGRLAIDCGEIKLIRNDPEEPSVFACAGSLSVTPEDGIKARLVIARGVHQPYDMFAAINEQFEIRSGQLFPPSRYFKLEAKDVAGNLWTNPSASVDIEHHLDAFVVKVSCHWVRSEIAVEGSHSATHMVFMDELRFPNDVIHSTKVLERDKTSLKLSSSGSAGNVAGMLVAFDPRVDRPGPRFSELFAVNQATSPLPDNFDDRLVEAVRFCAATVVEPVMRETLHNGKKVLEFGQHRPVNTGLLQPPLQPRGNDADFYKLLEHYFQYASTHAAGRDYAPLSAKVGGLFTLKDVNLDTVALLVSVAVEGVLGEKPFKELGKPRSSLLDQFAQMIAHIKSAATFEPGFIKRITDVIGGMKSSRVKDKLHALVEASLIDEKDLKAWNNTRNKAAHGSFEIDPSELQDLIDVVYRLSGLVYKLVFLRIGYRGKFTDYGVHAWPLREFTSSLASLSSPPAPNAARSPDPLAAKPSPSGVLAEADVLPGAAPPETPTT